MNTPSQFASSFLQEAKDMLARVEAITLEIEENPKDAEAVNRLFRVFHTIKGSGSMFGFDEVADFTHHIETGLDQVRAGLVPVTRELVDVILAAKDKIEALLFAPGGGESGDAEARQQIIARMEAIMPSAETESQVVSAAPPERSVSVRTESPLCAYRIHFQPEPGILARGMDPAGLLADLRALGDCQIVAKTEAIPALDQLVADECRFAWDVTLTTDRGADAIKDVFIFVEDESKITIEPVASAAADCPSCAVNLPTNTSREAAPTTPTKPSSPAVGEAAASAQKTNAVDGSVRVASEKLDRLVNLVGELVINQSRLSQVAGRLGAPELATPAEDLERLVAELRDIVLGIRMMPIGTTFSRFKRLVRDLAAELGKEIDLVTEGAETELDKTVLDQLGDPLVHLIRNAIDHGISGPDERVREGKPRRGTVLLSARHEGATVVIEIADDGRGLDKDAIRSKALERGLITADATLPESELFNLIFLPGFSTAKTVTNVSGRGVGMDVVKRQIDALRGSVRISSQSGQGTCIALTLPLTLAIIDGLLVEVRHEQFIIPMSAVLENVELTAAQRATGNGRNLLAVRGELCPYLRLREVFAITGDEQDIERVVIVTLGGHRIGLVVDRVIGSHQTVIQSLGRFYQNIEVVSGATIMGDGRVALILDVAGLIHYVDQQPVTSIEPLHRKQPTVPLKAA